MYGKNDEKIYILKIMNIKIGLKSIRNAHGSIFAKQISQMSM